MLNILHLEKQEKARNPHEFVRKRLSKEFMVWGRGDVGDLEEQESPTSLDAFFLLFLHWGFWSTADWVRLVTLFFSYSPLSLDSSPTANPPLRESISSRFSAVFESISSRLRETMSPG